MFNDRLDAALCALFIGVVLSVLVYSVKGVLDARAKSKPSASETPYQPMPEGAR